jgi:putative addiction module component (TIGR02574 family)
MPVNIEEIKKLPPKDKLRLIDDLLESIDDAEIEDYLNEEDDEIDNILKERWEKYQTGKIKFSPLEDVMERLRKNSEERNRKKK